MFLDRLMERNRPLAEVALKWQQDGTILPDTYVVDVDAVVENGRMMLEAANPRGIKLYFMLKQIGRNPYLAKKLMDEGFAGAVCVDYKEALVMARAGVKLGNVGHLVQTPKHVLPEILAARPDIMTVYTVEKAREISEEAQRQGFTQDIMLRVLGEGDVLYSGQYGGFKLDELEDVVDSLECLGGVRIAGVCSFPCFLYSAKTDELEPLQNLETVLSAAQALSERGYENLQINTPSASCTHVVPVVAAAGGTHLEPGHALTGTTPYHAVHADAEERVGYVYVSEVSHNVDGRGFCYGGGHYRRGHVANALVGTTLSDAVRVQVTPPTDESIDYHFELSQPCSVSAGVLMCARTQVFVTRSEVALVEGLSSGTPRLQGVYTALGERVR